MDNWILDLIYHHSWYGMALYVLITIVLAAMLSFSIGLERHLKGEPAGISTHVLLAIGCSLLMTISIWAIGIANRDVIDNSVLKDELNYDTSRIASAVVAGIGFLGGGVIIKDKFSVKGLSTASTLWISAAIGLACGVGFVLEAIVATTITLVLLITLKHFVPKINKKSPCIEIVCKSNYSFSSEIKAFAEYNGLAYKELEIIECGDNETKARMYFAFKTNYKLLQYVCNQFKEKEEVISINILDAKKSKK